MSVRKSTIHQSPKNILEIGNTSKDGKSFIERHFNGIDKYSIAKQIILGTTSGCVTGFLVTRIGKVMGFTIGSGIIMLQIANHQGYIKINWDKVNKKVDDVVDKVEEKLTGEGPNWMEKVERYAEKKIDKTEGFIRNKQTKAKRWYSSFVGDRDCQIREIHIFLASFIAGVAIGTVVS